MTEAQPARRAYAYIDGFNLYYGCLEDSPWKWLDVRKFIGLMFPKVDLLVVRYFTAFLRPRPGMTETKAEEAARIRQLKYVAALEGSGGVTSFRGHFLYTTPWRALALPVVDGTGRQMLDKGRRVFDVGKDVQVWDTEEKGSDVNLSTHLVMDAWRKEMDLAIVVTNDSDQAHPIQVVRTELNIPVAVVRPVLEPDTRPKNRMREPRTPSHELAQAADGYAFTVDPKLLEQSQLPNPAKSVRGDVLEKPKEW